MATVKTTLREAAQLLTGLSDTPRLDVELLMAHALGVSRSDLLIKHQDATVPAVFADHFRRRKEREPIAYILGEADFYGRTLAVSPDVLIPRGDSETLIEAALEIAPRAKRVIDLGTGSGALLLTFCAETGAGGVGIDASAGAVAVASANVDALGLKDRVTIEAGDWTAQGWADHLGQFDLVLCNPPYVESEARLETDVRDYEPASALFAGKDGLDDYRVLIPQLRKLLLPGGVAIVEIGHTQADAVSQIAEGHGFSVDLRHDLAKRPRALVLR